MQLCGVWEDDDLRYASMYTRKFRAEQDSQPGSPARFFGGVHNRPAYCRCTDEPIAQLSQDCVVAAVGWISAGFCLSDLAEGNRGTTAVQQYASFQLTAIRRTRLIRKSRPRLDRRCLWGGDGCQVCSGLTRKRARFF